MNQSSIHFRIAYLFLTTLIFSLAAAIKAEEYRDSSFDIEELLFDDLPDLADFSIAQGPSGSALNPSALATVLIDVGVPGLVEDDMYLRTNPLPTRNILDDSAIPLNRAYCGNTMWTMDLFYNMTPKMKFFRHSDSIGNYLAFSSKNFVDQIASLVPLINELVETPFEVDPVRLLSLLHCIFVEERKLGLMVQYCHRNEQWELLLRMPFYYLERNFMLSPRIQKALTAEFGAQDGNAAETGLDFARKHLIVDKVGFGDLRVNLTKLILDRPHGNMMLGGLLTIPTEWAFKQGLYGTHFERSQDRPAFNLTKFIDDSTESSATAELEKFALGALDSLAANLLEAPLGNWRHFGVGAVLKSEAYIEHYIPWSCCENLTYTSFLSAEFLTPKRETRAFIECGSPREFTFDQDAINESEAVGACVVDFLQTQIVNRLYPFVATARVSPGWVLRSVSAIAYEGDYVRAVIGSDTWMQTGESIRDIRSCRTLPCDLSIEKARRSFLYEGRLLGYLAYKSMHPEHEHTWNFGLSGAYPYYSYGIGQNFTLAIDVVYNF